MSGHKTRPDLQTTVKGERLLNLVKKRSCPHCGSHKLRYCGYSLSTIYTYFECQDCHKYSEYRFTSMAQIIAYLTLVPIFIILVVGAALVTISRNLALLFLTSSALLSTFILIRYGWAGQEVTALNILPSDDRIIIPVPRSKACIFVSSIFLSSLIVYIAIFIFNMIQQQ